jgi:hypothetical protein
VNLGLPKHNISITDRVMSLDWYKFLTRLVAAVETQNVSVTSSQTIAKIGTVYVDASGGAVTITPQAFPLTIQKTDATANAITIGGITVNGNPAYSFNTQYQAITIDTVDGLYYAR